MGEHQNSDAVRLPESHRQTLSITLFDSDHSIVKLFIFANAPVLLPERWRTIIGAALAQRCSCLLVDQYMSGGDVTPGTQSIAMTRRICRELRLLDIRLCDHVIRSDEATFSFRANGLL